MKLTESRAVRFCKATLSKLKIHCLKNVEDDQDESEGGDAGGGRETWSGKLDFFLSALGYAGWFIPSPILYFLT